MNQFLINCFKHFKTICIHKYWVFHYCRLLHITWQGITHDFSKFSPIEFLESAKFYMGTSSPINEAKKVQGYSMAWFHHKGRNRHHYEYWTDNYDKGTTCVEIPKKYVTEMIADYLGAARAYMGKEFSFNKEYEWWQKKRLEAKMHDNTKALLDKVFEVLNHVESIYVGSPRVTYTRKQIEYVALYCAKREINKTYK